MRVEPGLCRHGGVGEALPRPRCVGKALTTQGGWPVGRQGRCGALTGRWMIRPPSAQDGRGASPALWRGPRWLAARKLSSLAHFEIL